MHKSEIPVYLMERVKARRGKIDLYEKLEGKKTALLVVDLQNAFMLPGMVDEVPIAREIVPNVNRLAEATRKAGGLVVWIKMTLGGNQDRWDVFLDNFSKPEIGAAAQEALTPGHSGHELHADLDVRDGDLTVEKTRFSAFIQGSSDLHDILRARGIDTVLVTGTVTNTCCECTARDAMMLNYRMVFLSDANAGRTDEEHNATLGNILRIFGDVASTDEVVKRLG